MTFFVEVTVVVVVELVDVERDVLVELVLTEVVETLVLLVETEVLEVDVVNVVVDIEVELVEVLDVDVELVLLLVELVDVELVDVDVVALSIGSNSPTASLYVRPTTPAEANRRLVWLIACI